LVLLLATACVVPRSTPTFDAEGVEALDAVLREAVADGRLPGVVALVTTRDSILYRAAFGVMDATGQEPMRPDAIFRIFSMAKPLTSLGIVMLAQEGKVGLDAPAHDYLPSLLNREVIVEVDAAGTTIRTRPAVRPVTIRDLLRHTSGFGYTFSSYELLEWTRITGRPSIEQPLLHDPGARWTYGTSTRFLGDVIENVSGEPLDRFLQHRILEPLGMVDTSFELPSEKRERLVAGYARSDGVLRGEPPSDEYAAQVIGDGGSLLSTADDYARFTRLILGNGEFEGRQLLAADWMGEMTRDQLDGITVTEQPGAQPALSRAFPLGADRDGFSLAFQVAKATGPGERAPGSLSWAGLRNTHFWIDPTNGVGVVVLTQVLPFYDEGVIDVLNAFERSLYAHLN
jgi:CubicO group peptidase (beta-lactamase class C family)